MSLQCSRNCPYSFEPSETLNKVLHLGRWDALVFVLLLLPLLCSTVLDFVGSVFYQPDFAATDEQAMAVGMFRASTTSRLNDIGHLWRCQRLFVPPYDSSWTGFRQLDV